MYPDTLACSLMRISLFPGLSQAARDATRSVALLLAQLEQSTNMDATAERLAGQMLDKFTETVKAVTQAAVAEVTSASSTLMESSMQIAATTVSYRDALKSTTASPATGVTTLDARVRAQEGVKARQVLIDASAPNQPLHQAANNPQLVSLANDMLRGMDDPPTHRFVGARRLNNGGLLLEMDSKEAAVWIGGPHNKATFLSRFMPDAAFKSHMYSLVVQFVPLNFRLDDEGELHALEELNKLPPNAFLRARWIKPPYRRAVEQTCGHVLVVMTCPKDANAVLTDSLIICQKRVYAEKCKKRAHAMPEVPQLGPLVLRLPTAIQHLRDVRRLSPNFRMHQPRQATMRLLQNGRTLKLGPSVPHFP